MLLNIVLDTNALLVSVSERSPYHWIFRNLIERKYSLCLTTAIALEYESIISRHLNAHVAANAMRFMEIAPNVKWIDRFYRWQLIKADPDDDKFVDCAVAGHADYLVTEDKHFNVLREISFPEVNVITVEEFSQILTK